MRAATLAWILALALLAGCAARAPILGLGPLRPGDPRLFEDALVAALEHGLEQTRLRGEVIKQPRVSEAAARGNVAQRCAPVAGLAKHRGGGVENVLAGGGTTFRFGQGGPLSTGGRKA